MIFLHLNRLATPYVMYSRSKAQYRSSEWNWIGSFFLTRIDLGIQYQISVNLTFSGTLFTKDTTMKREEAILLVD